MPNITQVPNEPPDVLEIACFDETKWLPCCFWNCAHSVFLLVAMWKNVVCVG